MNSRLTQLSQLGTSGAINAAGGAALLAMSALFYIAALRPYLEHRQNQQQQERIALQEQQAAVDMDVRLRGAQQSLANARKQATGAFTLEPVQALNERLAALAALASAHGLELTDVRPGTAIVSGRFNTVPITLSGNGDFRGCVSFIHQMHDRLPDLAVTSMKLSAGAAPGDAAASSAPGGAPSTARNAHSPLLEFIFQLRWYAAAPAPSAVTVSVAQ